MQKIAKIAAAAVLLLSVLCVDAQALQLEPVGKVVGLELQEGSVRIAAFDERDGAAARSAGLAVGDTLVKINDVRVTCAADVKRALDRSHGSVTVELERGGQLHTTRLYPKITADGPKLGLYLRQGTTGIGTVTWYDPSSGRFGTLGHGVNDGKGNLLSMLGGSAYYARVNAVKKGKSGAPGQLLGAITDYTPAGELTANTERGVFGISKTGWQEKAIEVASRHEVKTGKATIRTTVEGDSPREYSVEILKIYPKSRESGRNLLIKVTDPALLEQTGGIVQGMSGSPIIQDGKLVGAVTHVLVNDPTTGYGIFIENMLDAAA